MKWSRIGRGRVVVEREGWSVTFDLATGRDRSKPRAVRRVLRREERRATAWARGGLHRAVMTSAPLLLVRKVEG